jgi:DNA-binding CsgD family transcriptional regulator/tetratricopeptide (TPR) repeat protein
MGDPPIGRLRELTQVEAFLDVVTAGNVRALAITGDAGIGKTTLWREGLRLARERGFRVLAARPTGVETRLSFSGLADLLRPLPETATDRLPNVQRDALNVALLRGADGGRGHSARAVATAVLSVLNDIAARGSLLVAVEDAQWLDAASADALSYAIRRLDDVPIGVLVSVRTDGSRPPTFEQALPAERRHDLELGPLSTAAIHDIIERELGRSFTRPVVVQIATGSGGNALYALEIAREVGRTGLPRPGRQLQPAEQLRALVRARIARLPASTRDALIVAAAMSQPRVGVVDADALEPAEDEGIVSIDSAGRITFSHPLLSAGVYESASSSKRRATHRFLAERVGDGEERARHLGLAAERPDEAVAEELERAAEHAAARGATAAACQLGRAALDLTEDPRGVQAATRTLALARNLSVIGQTHEAKALLEATLSYGLSGDMLARALLQLGDMLWYERDFANGYERLMQALDVAQDPILIARIHNSAAWISEQIDIARAIAHEDAVLDLLEPGPGPYSFALFYRSYLRLIDGQGADRESIERAIAMGMPTDQADVSPVPFAWHTWMDEFDTARDVLIGAVADASALGDEISVQAFLCQLASIECWAGNWARADDYATQVMHLTDRIASPAYLGSALFARGYVDAHLGRLSEARAAGEHMVALFENESEPQRVYAHWLLGFTALVAGNVDEADKQLTLAALMVEQFGQREPVRTRLHPDQAESAIAVGDLDRAELLIARLDNRARAFPRPWILATTARCRGLLLAARGDFNSSLIAMNDALTHHAQLNMPLERARTLLALGQVLRRRRAKSESRAALSEALAEFERLGADQWAERTKRELGRVPVRRASESLSATEQEIARLAASGLTNRQIAERAFVSPKTVEANIARIYRKLDIKSRAELGRAIGDRERVLET